MAVCEEAGEGAQAREFAGGGDVGEAPSPAGGEEAADVGGFEGLEEREVRRAAMGFGEMGEEAVERGAVGAERVGGEAAFVAEVLAAEAELAAAAAAASAAT